MSEIRRVPRVGDDVVGILIAPHDQGWQVDSAQLPHEWACVLRPREPRLYRLGDEVQLWAFDLDLKQQTVKASDSEFGRATIGPNLRPRYIRALRAVVCWLRDASKLPELEHFSEVKGMYNRSIRKDQWDWLTVWQYLGSPPMREMRAEVDAVVELRTALKDGATSPVEIVGEAMVETLAERLRALLGEVEPTTPRLAKAMRLEPVGEAESVPDEDTEARDPFIISRAARVKHERARASHQETLTQLAQLLSSAGFVPQENQYIDLYTHLRSDHGIFEIKSLSDTNERSQIRAALSQLYEYRYLHQLKPASLWLVLSQQPQQTDLIDYLEDDRDVRVLWREGDSFAGPSWELLRKRLQLTPHESKGSGRV